MTFALTCENVMLIRMLSSTCTPCYPLSIMSTVKNFHFLIESRCESMMTWAMSLETMTMWIIDVATNHLTACSVAGS